jgi:hypothetical protein
MNTAPYPRDLAGYGRTPPHAQWPGQARIAVQFVLNYDEGSENTVLHGDAGSEQFLSEMFNPPSFADRHLSMESIYEYGSRAGVWRGHALPAVGPARPHRGAAALSGPCAAARQRLGLPPHRHCAALAAHPSS